jgi:molecular chaperone HtpG
MEGAPKPVLEINPGHNLIAALAACSAEDKGFREDAVKLLLDQARVLDGDKPENPRAFAERLSRVFDRALKV